LRRDEVRLVWLERCRENAAEAARSLELDAVQRRKFRALEENRNKVLHVDDEVDPYIALELEWQTFPNGAVHQRVVQH
jgi:hypothetical protein